MAVRRVAKAALLALVAPIVVVLLLSALSNALLPTHSVLGERLSEADKARLAEARYLRLTLGDNVWPGWANTDIPVILYNEEYAFLTAAQDPADGWTTVPQNQSKGAQWEMTPGDTLNGQPYYRQRLSGGITPQAFVVKVGQRWVGSMTTRDYTSIELVTQMKKNLPAPLRAVFPFRQFVDVFNSDWHIMAVLHESFHAYQGIVPTGRLVQGEQANNTLSAGYPWDNASLRQAWTEELALWIKALQSRSNEDARQGARTALAARDRRRSAALEPALADFERQREWVEGLAKYTELEMWRQASSAPGYQPLAAMSAVSDFKRYTTFAQRWSSELTTMRNQGSSEGDGRFYYAGMAQAVLLDRLQPDWKARIFSDGVWLEGLLRQAVGQ